MGDEVMLRDFPEQKQRAAVCYRQARMRKEDTDMPTRLRKLTVRKVSLVPRGANPEAFVVLYKSADPVPAPTVTAGPTGTSEAVSTSSVVPHSKEENKMESKIDRSKLTKEEAEYLDSLEAAVTKSDPEPDPVPDIPEAVQKMLDEQKEAIAKAMKEAEEAKAEARVEKEKRERSEFAKQADTEFRYLPGTAVEKGDVLFALSKSLTPDQYAAVTKLLKAGDAAIKQASAEVGSADPTPVSSVVEKIEREAQEMMKSGGEKTLQQAIDRVLRENPDLYNEYRQEVGRRSYTN